MSDAEIAEAKAKVSAKAAKAAAVALVAMTKGGEELRVHPSCVGAHAACGWSLA